MVSWGHSFIFGRQVQSNGWNLRFSLRNEKETHLNKTSINWGSSRSFGGVHTKFRISICKIHPFQNVCFDWRTPNIYMGTGGLTISIHLKLVVWSSRHEQFEIFVLWIVNIYNYISIGWMKDYGEVIWLSLRGAYVYSTIFNVYYSLQFWSNCIPCSYFLTESTSEAFSSNHKKMFLPFTETNTFASPQKLIAWKTGNLLLPFLASGWNAVGSACFCLRCTEPSEWGWRRTQKGWI